MDISSSGESPFVVAARMCETRAGHAQRTVCRRAPKHVLLFRTRGANSQIVNIYTRSKDPQWSPSDEIVRAKGSESGKL